MYPKTTQYKIAQTHEDYRNCHALMEEDNELEYPTVMAERDGKAVGLIGTSRGEENLIASPMIANSIFTCIRLYEFYDETLGNLGIDHYLFNIEKGNTQMTKTVEKLFEIKPFTQTDDLLWYVRRL